MVADRKGVITHQVHSGNVRLAAENRGEDGAAFAPAADPWEKAASIGRAACPGRLGKRVGPTGREPVLAGSRQGGWNADPGWRVQYWALLGARRFAPAASVVARSRPSRV